MMWLSFPKALCYKTGTAVPPEISWILSDPFLSGLKLLNWKKILIFHALLPRNFSSCRIHQNQVANDLSDTKDTVGWGHTATAHFHHSRSAGFLLNHTPKAEVHNESQ